MTITPSTPNTGVVVRQSPTHCLIQTGDQYVTCHLANGAKNPGHVVVGDRVIWDAARQIIRVLPRRNTFSRRSASNDWHEQIIAANVDQVIVVLAVAKPRLAWTLLDRYLVSAELARIPVLVCLTKMDLVEDRPQAGEIEAVAAEYRAIGYDVVLTSIIDGRGLHDLQAKLQDRLSVLVGKSGVGKSSLINTIEPGLALRTQAVSRANQKGRHTTTVSQLFPLSCGGFLMDTPGIRQFGLWDVTKHDLALYFPEMRAVQHQCKFSDCAHDEEPGCAIRRAVMNGDINPYRYQSYLKLREEL